MKRILPEGLDAYIGPDKTIKFEGCTILHSCRHDSEYRGAALNISHQILFVLDGNLTIKTNQQAVQASAGQAILMRKGTNYEFIKRASPGGIYNSVLFFLNDAFVRQFLKSHPVTSDQAQQLKSDQQILALQVLSEHKLVRHFADSLLPYFGTELLNNVELMQAKTNEFMVLMSMLYPEVSGLFHEASSQGKLPLDEVMEQYFREHQITLEQLANLSGRSLATFKRDFTAHFKIAPAQWITQRRLTHAHQLLAASKLSIAEVAWESGFEDHSHFSRVFRKRFGHTPQSFRSGVSPATVVSFGV